MSKQIRHTNSFTGGLQRDLDYHDIPKEDWVNAMGLENGSGTAISVMENMLGNIECATRNYTLTGNNKVMGAVRDETTKSVIFFINEVSGNHRIVRWYADGDDAQLTLGEEKEVLVGSFLGIDSARKIHSAQVIDGELLVWTDGLVSTAKEIQGGILKKINLDKAPIRGKQLQSELHYGVFTPGGLYYIQVDDTDGNNIVPQTLIWTADGSGLTGFLGTLSTIQGTYDFSYENCGTFIKITADNIDEVITFSSDQSDFQQVATNYYPDSITADHIRLKKPQPISPITPEYVQDASLTQQNKVKGYSFQFAYRYIFDDGERGALSPYSYVPTNFNPTDGTNQFYENSDAYNKIVLTFDDDYLADATWKCFIRKVEVVVRYSNESPWRSVGTYHVSELGSISHELEFFNDSIYSVIPSDDNSTADSQAMKSFSHVPRAAASLKSISDKDGLMRLAVSGCLEGYDLPDCIRNTIDVQYDVSQPDGTSDQGSALKTLKAGGKYGVYVIYEDDFGRQSPAISLGDVSVPFTGNVSGIKGFRVTILSLAPSWASRYRLAITKNKNQGLWFQSPAWEVDYWIVDTESGTASTTTYGSGAATHVGFKFNVNGQNTGSFDNLIFKNLNENQNFLPEEGDRLQVVNYSGPGAPFDASLDAADFETLNYEVAGYSLTDPGTGTTPFSFTVFIEFDSSQPDFNFASTGQDFIVAEVYRKREAESKIAYEIGGPYEIDGALAHESPVTVMFRGDTYLSGREYLHNYISAPDLVDVPYIERPNLHLTRPETVGDFGRPVAEDPDYREVFDFSKIRLSDVYYPDSLVNGTSAFRGTEFIRLDRNFGAITKLAMGGNVLLAICEHKVQPIYVGSGYVQTLSGDTTIARSDRILNVASPLSAPWGTRHPASVTEVGNIVFGWDYTNGVVWQYSQAGLVPISDYGMTREFLDLSESNDGDSFGTDYYLTGYDPARKRLYFTKDTTRNGSVTWMFDTGRNRWIGQGPFYPEYYANVGRKFVTFDGGLLFIHNRPEVDRGVFYNSQNTWYVDIVVNSEPEVVKLLHRINVLCNAEVYVSQVITPANVSYPEGGESRINSDNFRILEGQQVANYLRDINDTNPDLSTEGQRLLRGRDLRGEYFTVRIQAVDPRDPARLYRAIHHYTYSQNID
jgi:hypothetical protein